MNLVFCVPEVGLEIATLETYQCRLFVFSAANFSNQLIQQGIHENKHGRMPHSKNVKKRFWKKLKAQN